MPAHDVHYDLPRIRRLAIDAIEALPDEELARARRRARVGRAARCAARATWSRRASTRGRSCETPPRRRRGAARDARAVPRAACERRSTPKRPRPRAEGGRRRPEGAAARADRARARPGAVGGDRRAAAGRGAAEGRCGSITRSPAALGELPAAARADPHVRLRPDRLPARPHRQRAAVRARDVAAALAARARLRRARSSTTSPTSTTRSTRRRRARAPSSRARRREWYLEDTGGLGLGRPDVEPKATETIPRDRRVHRAS